MDRKTLEYMEERAKKARDLVKRIDVLTENVEKSSCIKEVTFSSFQDDVYININLKHPSVVEQLIKTFVVLLEEEIQRSEKELAEL